MVGGAPPPRRGKVALSGSSTAEHLLLEQLRFDRTGRDTTPLPSPDWDQVVALAQRERVAPLVLDRGDAAAIPPHARARLEEMRTLTRIHNARFLMQLEEWLNRFDAANIPTIVLKGAALHAQVYDGSSLRPISDADILVPREDFERAGRMLQAAGWQPYREVTRHGEQTIRTQTQWIQDAPPNSTIDLHWHLIDSGYYARRVPMAWFWEHTTIVRQDARDARGAERSRTMRVLSAEAQLLHLAAHLAMHHADVGWLWMYDVAMLLRKFGDSLDWDLIFDAAQRFEWADSLRAAVASASANYGVAAPAAVAARLAALRPTWRERWARVLADPTAHQAAFIFDGLDQSNWRDRARYLARSLFPSAEFMRVHGPIRNRRDLIWQYARRLGRGMYRIPRALWSGVNEYRTNKRI